mmetsp:Transcript_32410/g.61027  ORF Transcript_32410/g.61027 Transcript_32410/m.61027 type:complete len:205 (+) Transcript_32410:674-1288(+)
MKERTLASAVPKAQAILGIEQLLLNLRRPRCFSVLILEIARREDPVENTWQIERPRPLLWHGVHLRVWPSSGKRRHENLVLVLRTPQHNVLDGKSKLPQKGFALLSGSDGVVDPQASILQFYGSHSHVDSNICQLLFLLKCPHSISDFFAHRPAGENWPQWEWETSDIQVRAVSMLCCAQYLGDLLWSTLATPPQCCCSCCNYA